MVAVPVVPAVAAEPAPTALAVAPARAEKGKKPALRPVVKTQLAKNQLALAKPDKSVAKSKGHAAAPAGSATASPEEPPADAVESLRDAIVASLKSNPEIQITLAQQDDARYAVDEARAGLATDPVWDRLSNHIAGLPCLTIAALNGTLAGGAMGMVLACDLRRAVPSAKFFYPVMKLGYLPQPADPARLDAARYGDFGAFMVQTGLIKTAPPVDAIAVDLSAK